MTCRKTVLSSNQRVNLQLLYHLYLKVFVNQLSQKQTLSIRSMYKLCLGKNLFLATPLTAGTVYLEYIIIIVDNYSIYGLLLHKHDKLGHGISQPL